MEMQGFAMEEWVKLVLIEHVDFGGLTSQFQERQLSL